MIYLLLLALVTSDVRPLTLAQVCATKWSADTRHVTLAMRHAVFVRDKVLWADHTRVVLDHVVPRQLAGADVIANLQVQTRAEAHTKDRIELKLHRMVCDGQILLKTAQDEIRTDWRAAYYKYLGVPPSR